MEVTVFWKNLPLQLEEKSDSAKSNYLKALYILYITSIGQSGYHSVVTSSEGYRVSVKNNIALGKSEKRPKWKD